MQVLHGLACDHTRSFAMTCRPLTALVVVQPYSSYRQNNFDQVSQYLGARPQFHKRFLVDHFPYLRFIYAWISDILPVIVSAPICPFLARFLRKCVLFAPGYFSNLSFSRRVTVQICSFRTRLLLKSAIFAPG